MTSPIGVLHFDVLTSTAIGVGVSGGAVNVYTPAWATVVSGVSGAYLAGRKTGGYSSGLSQSNNSTALYWTISRTSGAWAGWANEVWVTMGLYFPYNTLAIPSGNTLFKWGDVSIIMLNASTIQVKNVSTVIATLTHPGMVINAWYDCLVHIKLDAATGQAGIAFDGIVANSATNLNTVGTTALASATTATLTANNTSYSSQILDDVCFFTSVPPTDASGNQIYPRMNLDYGTSDYALNNFSGSPSGTVSAALQTLGDSVVGQGAAAGSNAVLTPTNRSSIANDSSPLFGFNVIAQGCKKLDSTARTLSAGVTLNGVDEMSGATALSSGSTLVIDKMVTANTYLDSDFASGNVKLKVVVG